MKGIVPLFLGIFGTFAFSWAGLVLVPNFQIGHLEPLMDEEGTDVYPMPKSGMADRGRKIYAANGCTYCHSQQVRADYAASDMDRKWGTRRSAPRDYLFERPVELGKMRMGPDLANIGKRAPSEEENASPAPQTSPGASPAVAPNVSPSSSASPATSAAPSAPPAPPATTSPSASPAKAVAANSPATAPASPSPATSPAASPANAVAANSPAPASPSPAASPSADKTAANDGPPQYSAAWHHRHLYSPRSITLESNMPAYRFLYEKRRISGERAAAALNLSAADAPPDGWEIVPTYDAKCLVAYLMSLDQSHALPETMVASAPAPFAPASSPAAAASPSPAPTKEAK
jgi:cbb3-type cytochrome oxidase cytochrome c subunit